MTSATSTKFFLARVLTLLVIFVSVSVYSPKAQALDPKTKTVLTMAGYGTAGGALLGVASLAFGADGRAVSVGASLGLYAGLIFGSYVVLSHRMQRYEPSTGPQERNYYPGSEGTSPYSGEPDSSYDWFGNGGDEGQQNNQYWEQIRIQQDLKEKKRTKRKIHHWGGESPNDRTLFYMDLVRYSF